MRKKKMTTATAPAPKKEKAPKKDKPATDVGIETPTEAAPVVTSGVATRLGSISFAAIDPALPIEQRKGRVRELLHQAVSAEGKLEIVQGELLYEANKNGYWKSWEFTDDKIGVTRPYANWAEFLEKELGFKDRKAKYLIDMYETYVVKLNLPEETLKTLEWSKAALVTKIVTPENWGRVLKAIGDMNWYQVGEFAKEVKESKDVEQAIATVTAPKALPPAAGDTSVATPGAKKEAGEEFKTFSCKLSLSQLDNVNKAIAVAKSVLASDSNAHALDIIASEYLSSTRSDTGKADIVAGIIKNLEDNYGVVVEIKSVPDDLAEGDTKE